MFEGLRKSGVIFFIINAVILVRNLEDKLMFRLDLTLNEDGEWRFKVEGEEGEFLPWQVAQKALEDILF